MLRRSLLGSFIASGTALAGLEATAAESMAHGAHAAQPAVPLLDATLLPAGGVLQSIARLENQTTKPGHFKATLTAAPLSVPLIPGLPATEFWTYNGGLPGPLIELHEGDLVDITFVNQLPQPSTIHWHGLPVPSEQDGNPWDLVPPGGSRTYRFKLPMGTSGNYWYHPHPHHYTAEQAFRGLAGPIIVRPRKDPLAVLPERLLVVSDLKLDARGAIAPSDANDLMNGREGQFALVNAQNQPVLPFHAGGRERWRIVNASSARYLRLVLPGTSFALVGTDGGLLEKPQLGLTEILMTPAQRVDLVVDAGTRRDKVELRAEIYQRGKMGDVPPEKVMPLLTVDFGSVTQGAERLSPLPRTLAVVPDLGMTKSRKRVVFSENMSMEGGVHTMQFLVNGKEYDMKRMDLVSRVNEVELWDLVNESDMDHPFHLHGTQFQVVERVMDGVHTRPDFRAWNDTVNLRSGETVRIKTVQRLRGVRMFHCHVLEHEDAGMMGQLKVV
jgi:bilirubin oxidase